MRIVLALAAGVFAFIQASVAEAAFEEVIASTPYQVTSQPSASDCNNTSCTFTFPVVPAKQRVDIEFVSCRIAGAKLDMGEFYLGMGNPVATTSHYLLGTSHLLVANGNTFYIVSQPVTFSVPAGRRPGIKAFYFTDNIASYRCTISGQLRRLK